MSLRVVQGRLAASTEVHLSRLAAGCAARPRLALLVVLLLTIGSTVLASRLRLSSDLVELLPESFESVQELDRVVETFGGFGYVVVVARGAEPEELVRFAERASQALEQGEHVRYVDYRRPRDFFDERALYYLDLEDLEIIEARMAEREAYERRVNNPFYVDLEDEEPPPLEFPELEAKYGGRDNPIDRNQTHDGYFLDPDERMLALFVKPTGAASDLDFAQVVVDEVQDIIAGIDLAEYGPDMEIVYGGAFIKKLDTQRMIGRDLKFVTLLALTLVLLYIGYHFRRVGAVAMLLMPLIVGLSWTYGFASLSFGTLNILTGFIGAILLGLGIDHGIHLFERFGFEYARTHVLAEAVRTAFGSTGRAVGIAALTTGVAFGGLGISEFRAFYEFGIISAFGMFALVAAYLTVLPALLGLAIRWGWRPRHVDTGAITPYARWLPGRARLVAALVIVAALGLSYTARDARFNYDTRSLVGQKLLSFQLDAKLDGLLGYSQTPVIFLARDEDEEARLAAAVRARQERHGEATSIDLVMARSDFVPEDQRAKQPIIERICEFVSLIDPEGLEPEQREHLERVPCEPVAIPFTYQDLPVETRRQFEGPSGAGDASFVLVFSNLDVSDGANAVTYAREVQGISIDGLDGPVSAAGDVMIMADVYDMVSREASPVLLTTLGLIFLTIVVLMGSLRRALLCMIPTGITMIGTFGLSPLTGVEFNTLNIVMIPVLFGVGVDGGVHIIARLTDTATLPEVISETGRAIAAAILTTALAFGSIVLSSHDGLQSLGLLALLGLAVNTLACLVALPALLAAWPRTHRIAPPETTVP